MHIFVLGLSKTGKTTLCCKLSEASKRAKKGVIVFDPRFDNRWACDFKTANFDEFASVYETSRSCYAFIDECFLLTSPEHKAMLTKMMAVGRHFGHTNVVIGQRATAVPKTARMLCERMFVFKQAPPDAKDLYADYPYEQVRALPQLKRGEYLDITTYDCDLRKIF